MRIKGFKRCIVSILLVFALMFSMISVAPLASSGDWVNNPEPGGTTIEVVQGDTFLIRHALEWNEPEDGAYTITIAWDCYDNDPSQNFTFVGASAYFTTGPNVGESILAVVKLGSAPAGTNTKHVLSVKCPADQKDPRNGQFNVDITLSASGVGGVPHIVTDNHPIPFQFAGIIIIENSMRFWNRDPITIRVLPKLISISPNYQSGLPGTTLEYIVTVTNTGIVEDTYDLTVADTQAWAPMVSPTSLTLASGSSGTATLTVTIPRGAADGATDSIIVTATSQADSTVSASNTCTAIARVVGEVEVTIYQTSKTGKPGNDINYTVTVRNAGTSTDTFSLQATDTAGWSPRISPSTLTLDAGASGTATLTVTIPDDAAEGDSTTITVTASGTGYDDSITSTARVKKEESRWDAFITATFSGGSDDAVFSVRPDATPDFDSAYDIPEPPAPVAPSYVRTFFYYLEQIPDELHRSCLAPKNLMGWPLRIEYADGLEDITLMWNVEDVPVDYSIFLYWGENLVADMRAGENYTFEASTGSYDFRIVVGKLLPFTLELAQGWNMISFPVLPENSSPDAIFDGYYVLYRWDAEDKHYMPHADSGSFIEPDPDVEAGVGYWAYVLEDENVDLLGVPVYQLNLSLRQGWNLIGSPYGGSSIADLADDPDNSVIPWAFTWNAHERSYSMTQLLEAGKGYWAYALQPPQPPYPAIAATSAKSGDNEIRINVSTGSIPAGEWAYSVSVIEGSYSWTTGTEKLDAPYVSLGTYASGTYYVSLKHIDSGHFYFNDQTITTF